ncbi:hypothetical protein M378DRAFT_129195 [Amanita muscaria Koide BX008]|uniref:Uncharacterized protein n=1 Tax=Amanita muscaria (strain Koide BX008) TaxID=946122 RepID=A0A0C2X091_AMAMK|nr:hypothetical protein M378DRAFT_129195 [Amanita muscaria Koide BX008]
MGLPSFSDAKWSELAPQFGLHNNVALLQLPTFVTPVYLLPPTFHVANFTPAWPTLDVYRDIDQQTREEARVRILDPYIVPILALFQGRIVDMPMMESQYSSGGDVEHEIIMVGGILFFVIQLKHLDSGGNNLAQLFLKLLSAAAENGTLDFTNLRVYGLLTDLTKFEFYSYDPLEKQFSLDEEFSLETRRNHYCFGMIHVTNKIFSVVMHGYVRGLEAIVLKREKTMPPGSSEQMQRLASTSRLSTPMGSIHTGVRRESTSKWEHALRLANDCLDVFQRPFENNEDIEKNGKEALELLAQSVYAIPRFTKFTGSDNDAISEQLSALALELVARWHEKKLQRPLERPLYPYP